MKIIVTAAAVLALLGAAVYVSSAEKGRPDGCLTGAFLADEPSAQDIRHFKAAYGKQPYLIMVFIEWGAFVKPEVVRAVYGAGSALLVTWEPWYFAGKRGIDVAGLLAGKDDAYIRAFAARLKEIRAPVYVRFAHEMNGDWYPWSSAKIGPETYVAMYRHVRDVCDAAGADNLIWVWAVNWEDIPRTNAYMQSYPGDDYVDHIGLDGYNWGTSQPWSRWMSFSELFASRYAEIAAASHKPIMISEFGSSSRGGDKARWIADAMDTLRSLPRAEAFVLFAVDKETDWGLPPGGEAARAFSRGLADGHFKER